MLASRRALVTVEEIVDELDAGARRGGAAAWVVDAIAVVPGGAAPSYAQGYYDRDNAAYRAWDAISRDRERVPRWLERSREVGRVITRRRDDDASPPPARCATARCASSGSACRRTAANLARRLHAPDLVLIYESGTLDTRPERAAALDRRRRARRRPRSRSISVPEVFNYWLQPGRIDVGFLSGAQIDRFGNLNTTVIGEYDEPDRAAARRRRRAGDRGVLPRGDRRDAAPAAGVRRPGRLRHLRRLRHGTGRPRRCSACAAAARPG